MAAASGSGSASAGPTDLVSRVRSRLQRPPAPFNIPAFALVVAGFVLQLLALIQSTWLSTKSGRLVFTGMREWAKPGYASAYFSWLAIVLLALTAVLGGLACWHWRPAAVFRYIGASVGVLGIFLTVGAVLLLAYQSHNDIFHVARNYSVGPYLMVLGLFVSALAAAGGNGRRG